MMAEENQLPPKQQKPQKKSRKVKADVMKAQSKNNHNTRRRKNLDSSQENLMPAQIPKSSSTIPIVTEGRQNETTKLVIRIPITILTKQKSPSQLLVQTHLQSDTILIQIVKEGQYITLSAKLKDLQAEKQMQVQGEKQSKLDKKNKKNKKMVEQAEQPVKENSSSNPQNDQQQYLYLQFDVWGKYVFLFNFEVHNKVIKKTKKQITTKLFEQLLKIKLPASTVTHQNGSDLLIYFNLKATQYGSEEHNGLINQGNTCYMNSYLQTLYHIPEFRNLVYEAQTKDQTKFPATLQDLFFNLAHSQKPVSAENLVKSFGWGKKDTAVQQDAQQFSCLFFQILEHKLSQSQPKNGYKSMTIRQLFRGQLNHYIRCTNIDFMTKNDEQFIDLQLAVFPTLQQSLDAYTSQVHLDGDNKYLTQDYGLQQAYKGVRISLFPPILMLQLKRFDYDYQHEKNIKILDRLEYPQTLDFSKWSLNSFPSQSQQMIQEASQQYELYAVMVHQGSKADSGHYYNFVKSQDGKWYKCNDQSIQEVTKQKVYDYNFGGFHESLQFQAKQMKFQKKFVEARSTAYMLVYIKKQLKQRLMTDNNKYPDWLRQKQSNKIFLEEQKKIRKFYFHKIRLFDWEQDLLGKQCSISTFVDDLVLFERMDQKVIQKVEKQMPINAWLKLNNFIQQDESDNKMQVQQRNEGNQKRKISKMEFQSKKSYWTNPQGPKQSNKNSQPLNLQEQQVQEKQKQIGVYAYTLADNDRQNLTSQPDHKSTMFSLLKNLDDPFLFTAPIQATKQQYLVICKRFTVDKPKITEQIQIDRQKIKPKFVYDNCFTANKNIIFGQLRSMLQNNCKKNSQFQYQYFMQDTKGKILEINEGDKGFLPAPTPHKNQLFICIIQQIHKQFYQQFQQPKSTEVAEKTQQTKLSNKQYLVKQKYGFESWYVNKRSTCCLVVSDQKDDQTESQIKQIHETSTLSQLRSQIFQKIIKGEKNDKSYESPDNIVLKARFKKTSKAFSEIPETPDLTLKDLIKYENKIKYAYSSLSVQSRASNYELTFYFRFSDFSFSDPITIIVDRKEGSASIVNRIKNHPQIQQYLKKDLIKGSKSAVFLNQQPQWLKTVNTVSKSPRKQSARLKNQSVDCMLIMLNKNKNTINDIVQNDGKVIGKGDFETIIKKEKNSIIAVESINILKAQPSINAESQKLQNQQNGQQLKTIKEQIQKTAKSTVTNKSTRSTKTFKASSSQNSKKLQNQNKQDINQNQNMQKCQFSQTDDVYITLHHVSQNLDKVGIPQQFITKKSILFSDLRTKVLDLILNQSYQYQGKAFTCNPFKLRIKLYSKDSKKVYDLEAMETFQTEMQMDTLKVVDKENQKRDRRSKSRSKSKSRKASMISGNEQSQPLNNNIKGKKDDNAMEVDGAEEQEERDKSSQQCKLQSENLDNKSKENAADQQIQQQIVQGPSTIAKYFPKTKVLKIQVVHSEMTKPNIALKFNLDN